MPVAGVGRPRATRSKCCESTYAFYAELVPARLFAPARMTWRNVDVGRTAEDGIRTICQERLHGAPEVRNLAAAMGQDPMRDRRPRLHRLTEPEGDMGTDKDRQQTPAQQPEAEDILDRQYHEIGIGAVAAACRFAHEPAAAAPSEPDQAKKSN
jgi:hypothetical protein